MGNDAVFEQALAFLESFRIHNPRLKLAMIPFADDIQKIERLAPIFDFEILKLDTSRWDEMAHDFYPGVETKYKNRLRKLAIFDLDHPAVMYIDLDTVILQDLTFVAEKLCNDSVDFICTAIKNDPWVYNEKFKTHAQFAQSKRFSDGFFAFNARKIGHKAYTILRDNKALYYDVRATDVYSQPATNFVVDMLGLRVAEVYRIYPNVSPQTWYAGRLTEVDGTVLSQDGGRVLFVHWAGPVDFTRDFKLKSLFEHFQIAARARIAEFSAVKDRQ